MYYVLEHRKVIPTDSYAKWLTQLGSSDRQVAFTEIMDIEISTVFLGLDYNLGRGKPLLFETIVFGGVFNRVIERYSTWEEAEEGHAEILKLVKESLEKK